MPDSGFLFGDKKHWTDEEIYRLDELLSDFPARAAITQFAAESEKRFGTKRTRGAVTTVYKRKKEFHKYRCKYEETPIHVPIFVLVQGLQVSKSMICYWVNKLGLRRDLAASSHTQTYFHKSELRRFFMEHPKVLGGITISKDFAKTFVEILTYELPTD